MANRFCETLGYDCDDEITAIKSAGLHTEDDLRPEYETLIQRLKDESADSGDVEALLANLRAQQRRDSHSGNENQGWRSLYPDFQ